MVRFGRLGNKIEQIDTVRSITGRWTGSYTLLRESLFHLTDRIKTSLLAEWVGFDPKFRYTIRASRRDLKRKMSGSLAVEHRAGIRRVIATQSGNCGLEAVRTDRREQLRAARGLKELPFKEQIVLFAGDGNKVQP